MKSISSFVDVFGGSKLHALHLSLINYGKELQRSILNGFTFSVLMIDFDRFCNSDKGKKG